MFNLTGIPHLVTGIKRFFRRSPASISWMPLGLLLAGCASLFSGFWMPKTLSEFEISFSSGETIEKRVDFQNHTGRRTTQGLIAKPYHIEILDRSLKEGYWPELKKRWDENNRMHRMRISISIYDGDSLFFEVPTQEATGNASYRNGIPIAGFFLPAIEKQKNTPFASKFLRRIACC